MLLARKDRQFWPQTPDLVRPAEAQLALPNGSGLGDMTIRSAPATPARSSRRSDLPPWKAATSDAQTSSWCPVPHRWCCCRSILRSYAGDDAETCEALFARPVAVRPPEFFPLVNRRGGQFAGGFGSNALKTNKKGQSGWGHDRRRLGPHLNADSVIRHKELLSSVQGA
jgi:hypothetical protein